jgi:tetratricopeptide (TPR) repeat protein
MNQFTDAVRSYSRAIELDASSLDAKTGLASAQWAAGMRAEAGAAFEALIRNNPRDAVVYETYGTLLLDSAADEVAEARGAALLKTAVRLDASRAEAHYQLGNLALKQNQIQEAQKYLETAARLDPREGRIQFALARLYRRLGRADDAAKAMRLYEELRAEETGAAVPESGLRVQPK